MKFQSTKKLGPISVGHRQAVTTDTVHGCMAMADIFNLHSKAILMNANG